jgi:glycosyltransferase involved in cell wall biosynthesis
VAETVAELGLQLRIIGPVSAKLRSALDRLPLVYSTTEGLSDEDLVREYVGSDVLAFVSTYEGFGLPILEAQAVGLPVVTSKTTSMPEVAGDGALIVDPYDRAEIAAAIHAVLSSQDQRRTLVERGFSNVRRFTPEHIAERYATIYRQFPINSRST